MYKPRGALRYACPMLKWCTVLPLVHFDSRTQRSHSPLPLPWLAGGGYKLVGGMGADKPGSVEILIGRKLRRRRVVQRLSSLLSWSMGGQRSQDGPGCYWQRTAGYEHVSPGATLLRPADDRERRFRELFISFSKRPLPSCPPLASASWFPLSRSFVPSENIRCPGALPVINHRVPELSRENNPPDQSRPGWATSSANP